MRRFALVLSVLVSGGQALGNDCYSPSFAAVRTFGAGSYPQSIAAGDFNGDGRPDLAVANYSSGDVSVLMGIGDGTFQPAASHHVGNNPSSVSVSDFNADGFRDLAVATGANVSVLLGNGDGTFQAAASFGAGDPGSVAVGDFNGDGKPDLVVGSGAFEYVFVLLGKGDGSFQASVNYRAGRGKRPLSRSQSGSCHQFFLCRWP